jgi:Uncharacterised conserved protein (DUF2362)
LLSLDSAAAGSLERSNAGLGKSRSFSFSKLEVEERRAEQVNSNSAAVAKFFGTFNSSDATPFDSLSDAFTVYSGSQVRAMTNLRLRVVSNKSLFQSNPDPVQGIMSLPIELAIRAQTCIAMYSQSLTGIVVLLKLSEFENYCTKASVNRGAYG